MYPSTSSNTIGNYSTYVGQLTDDTLIKDFKRSSIFILDTNQYYQMYQMYQYLDTINIEEDMDQFAIQKFDIEDNINLLNALNALKILIRQSTYHSLVANLIENYGPLVNIGNNLKLIIIDGINNSICSITKISYIDIDIDGEGDNNYTIGYAKLSIPIDNSDIVINTTIDLFYQPNNSQQIEYLKYNNISCFSKYILLPYLEGKYHPIDDITVSININNFWDNIERISIPNSFSNFIIFIDSISIIYPILEPIGIINIPQLSNYDLLLLQYNNQLQLFDIFHYLYTTNYQEKTLIGRLSCPMEKLYQHNYLFIIHLFQQLPITTLPDESDNIILSSIKTILHYNDNDQLINNSIICGNNNNFSNYMNIIKQEDFEFVDNIPVNKTKINKNKNRKTRKLGFFGRGKTKRKNIYYKKKKL